MGWLDKLEELLRESGDPENLTAPFRMMRNLQEDVWGLIPGGENVPQLAARAPGALLNAYDIPRQAVGRPLSGALALGVAGAQLGISELDERIGNDPVYAAEEARRVLAAAQAAGGLGNPYAATIAAHEEEVHDNPLWAKAVTDTITDPLALLPLARGGTAIGAGIRTAGAARGGVVGAAQRGLGSGLIAAERVAAAPDILADRVVIPGIKKGLGKARKIPAIDHMLSLAPREVLRKKADERIAADINLLNRMRTTAAGTGGELAGEELATQASMQGAPSGNFFTDNEATRRLVTRRRAHPIVNTLAQRADEARKRIASRQRGYSGKDVLGIRNVETRPGRFVLRFDTEQEIQDAVEYSAGLITTRAPLDPNDPHTALRRSYNGLQSWRKGMIEQYGEGIEPVLPMIYRRQAELEGAKLPNIQLAGPTRGASNVLPQEGDLSPDQMVEAAARWGAGNIQLSRQGGAIREFLPGGKWHTTTGGMKSSVRGLFGKGDTDGMSIMSREDFRAIFDDQFGEGTPDELKDQIYDQAVGIFHRQMVEAVKEVDESSGALKKLGQRMLPNQGDMESMVDFGRAGMKFYEEGTDELADLFGSDQDFRAFLGLIAATSPRTNVSSNIDGALRHWVDWKIDGPNALKKYFTPDQIEQFNLPGSKGFGLGRDMGSRIPGVRRVIEGAQLETQKVRSFLRNFEDNADAADINKAYAVDPNSDVPPEVQKAIQHLALSSQRAARAAVTVDTHHQRAMSLPQGPSAEQFAMQEAAAQVIARHMNITPEEVQSAIWYTSKKLQGDTDLDTATNIASTAAKRIKEGQGDRTVDLETGEITPNPTPNMQAYTTEQGLAKLDRMYTQAKKQVDDALADSSKNGRGESMTFELEHRGADDLAGEMGAPVLSFTFDPETQDVAREMLNLAFATRNLAQKEPNRFRWVVNADAPNSVNAELVYYPRAQNNEGQEAMLALIEARMTDELLINPERQMQDIDAFMDQVINADNGFVKSLRAEGKDRMGRTKKERDLSKQDKLKYTGLSKDGKEAIWDPGQPETVSLGITDNKAGAMADIILDQVEKARRAWEGRNGDDAIIDALDYDVQELIPKRQQYSELLSPEENDLLNETFDDGETVRTFLARTRSEMTKARELLNSLGISWESGEDPTAALKKFDSFNNASKDTQKFLRKVLKTSGSVGSRNLLKGDIDLAARQLMEARMFREAEVEQHVPRGPFRDLVGAWKEIALTSLRYHAANWTSGYLHSFLAGTPITPAATEAFRAFRSMNAKGTVDWEDTKVGEELSDKFGIGVRRELGATSTADLSDTGKKYGDSATRRVLKRLPGGDVISKAAIIPEANAVVAQISDGVIRTTTYAARMNSYFSEHVGELAGKLVKIAQDSGVRLDGDNLFPEFRGKTTYNPAILRDYYQGLGVKPGHANRMANETASLIKKADSEGLKRAGKAHFTYRRTNLDDAIGRFVPFHYWASRALVFYGEEAMRNPALVSAFSRMQSGIEHAQEDPGLSARQKGFLSLLDGPQGFTLLMNPDALFGVVESLGLRDSYEPDGETTIGGAMRWLKSHGVGLFPWIDGSLNMLGAYGNTFEPDMIGIRHRAIVSGIVNWARGEGLLGEDNMHPGAAPYAEMNAAARETVSTWASTFMPDWAMQPVPQIAAGSLGRASLDSVIESRIIAENPGITNGELAAIMMDPDSPQYRSAFEDASTAGAITQLLNFSLPFQSRVRENTRDVRNAQTAMIRAEADQAGVAPWEWVPTQEDVDFATEYKKQTGKDWQPGDYQTANAYNQIVQATPEAKPFVAQEQQYNSLGTPAARLLYDTYMDIKTGTKTPAGVPMGRNELERQMVADTWLRRNDPNGLVAQLQAQKNVFEETHPEFGAFKGWQGQMFDLKARLGGDLSGYRAKAAQQNPNAARYFEDIQQRVSTLPFWEQKEELDRMTTNSEAYFAIIGQAKERRDPMPMSMGAGDPQQAMLGQLPEPPYTGPKYRTWADVLKTYS